MASNHLDFVVVGFGATPPRLKYPSAVLQADSWDDFGFKTTFSARLHTSPDEVHQLGIVKILQEGQERGRTPLPSSFRELGEQFCSLGQDIEYYETLMEDVPEKLRARYLSAQHLHLRQGPHYLHRSVHRRLERTLPPVRLDQNRRRNSHQGPP